MQADIGAKIIATARSYVGSHYLNGTYGVTPGLQDGHPHRPGGVDLIVSPDRLDPVRNPDPRKNLAVYAAAGTVTKQVKDDDGTFHAVARYCVCAGNASVYSGARATSPDAHDLKLYLDQLRATPRRSDWPYWLNRWTPRRAFGPGQSGGEIGGTLLWAEPCKGIKHFDAVGFISYCIWEATGAEYALDIAAWRKSPHSLGATVYDFNRSQRPFSLEDADIIVKADHHIAFVAADGAIVEAQDTDVGVSDKGRFSLRAPDTWSHLVRLKDFEAESADQG